VADPDKSRSEGESSPQWGLHAFAVSAAGRIRSLAEETDRVIAGIQADAKEHAARTAEDAGGDDEPAQLLQEFAETLTEYAVGLRQQCEELYEILERASVKLDVDDSGSESGDERGNDEVQAEASEGLRLLATQMAAAGSDRAEIEQQLRVDFGVVNARELLDEIFSP
jgi:hypothetical protein